MRRESHVRFCESVGVRLSRATLPEDIYFSRYRKQGQCQIWKHAGANIALTLINTR